MPPLKERIQLGDWWGGYRRLPSWERRPSLLKVKGLWRRRAAPSLTDPEADALRDAEARAAAYLHDPWRMGMLVRRAQRKADQAEEQQRRRQRGPLPDAQDAWRAAEDGLGASLRLLRAYARREYAAVPWNSLVLVTAAVLYFVNPFDAIPDFLLGCGLLDDAAVLGMALRAIGADLAAFQEWERDRLPGESS